MTTNARDEKWSEWKEHDGVRCPLPINTPVEVEFRDGSRRSSVQAMYWAWKHKEQDDDIIAYRYKIKEPESDMDADLKWLSENVSEWYADKWKIAVIDKTWPDGELRRYVRWPQMVNPESGYTYSQWLQARKDLGLIMSDEEEEMAAEDRPKRNLYEEIKEGFDAMEKSRIGGKRTAENFLHEAAKLMAERGKQYDQPGGERSMGKAVSALNAITGRDLTEAEGWLLMSLVKRVRQHSGAGYHQDSAEDAVAYAALEAEALESAG